jgi:hypothetical protein
MEALESASVGRIGKAERRKLTSVQTAGFCPRRDASFAPAGLLV